MRMHTRLTPAYRPCCIALCMHAVQHAAQRPTSAMQPIQSSRAGPFRTKHCTSQLPVTCTPLARYQGIIWLPARQPGHRRSPRPPLRPGNRGTSRRTGRDGTGRRGAGGERTPPRPSRGSAAGGAGRARSTQLTSLGEEAAACTEATYLSTSGFVRRTMAPSPAVRPALVVTDLWSLARRKRKKRKRRKAGTRAFKFSLHTRRNAHQPPIAATRDVTARGGAALAHPERTRTRTRGASGRRAVGCGSGGRLGCGTLGRSARAAAALPVPSSACVRPC